VSGSRVHPVDLGRIHEDLLAPVARPGRSYVLALAALAAVLVVGGVAWLDQVVRGLHVTGLNNPVGWGIYITTFVFWVGIAHSGTLISAVLLLFRARFRPAISRAAEAMTVFAVMTAGLFPLVHLGRVWKFYYLLPLPNERMLWPNFRSPLLWDVFAVTTYVTVSTCFLYYGLIPDLAALRDRSTGWQRTAYGLASLGWEGTDQQWRHYRGLYVLLAGLATPLVISVHSVVSWDFAVSVLPGWHTTIFPPYFVAGAILSGLAMVLTLGIPLRRWLCLEHYITIEHFDKLARLLLFTSLIVTYSYAVEYLMAFYSGDSIEIDIFTFRATGAYGVMFAVMLLGNSIAPATFFFARCRRSLPWLFTVSVLVNIGMWLERYWLITSSLSHDFDPAAWGSYSGSTTEFLVIAGSMAMFLLMFWTFVRVVPPVPLNEVKEEALLHGELGR